MFVPLVVNTADWCAGHGDALGDSVRRMLADEHLKSRIDSDVSLSETFHALGRRRTRSVPW